MPRVEKNEIFLPGTGRIEAFSDGVFAIIVTLLILDLKVPEFPDEGAVPRSFDLVTPLFPQFVSFTASFFVVAIFWANHHAFFHILERANSKILWLNNLVLFFLSIVPFPTALIGRYFDHTAAAACYALVLFLAAVTFHVMYVHAARSDRLMYAWVTKQDRAFGMKRGLLGPILYGTAFITAFLSPRAAEILFLLVPILYFIPQKVQRSLLIDESV